MFGAHASTIYVYVHGGGSSKKAIGFFSLVWLVWFDLVWFVSVCFGLVWFGLVGFGMVLFCLVWFWLVEVGGVMKPVFSICMAMLKYVVL